MKNIIIILCFMTCFCKTSIAFREVDTMTDEELRNEISSRPFPEIFREIEAVRILAGQKERSEKYPLKVRKWKYYHFLKSSGDGEIQFYRQNGEWCIATDTTMITWKVDWILVASFVISLLLIFFSNFRLIKRFLHKRSVLLRQPDSLNLNEGVKQWQLRLGDEAARQIFIFPMTCSLIFAPLSLFVFYDISKDPFFGALSLLVMFNLVIIAMRLRHEEKMIQ